ncbi:Fic family protein [Actinomyces respiraculi]|nr:Fic/DOC family N-terminal domain-containing protein [Actinomyces respiraculi]
MFRNPAMGQLVTISGSDPLRGSWEHKAFVPTPLPHAEPELGGATYRAVAAAGRALAALDATARRLPNPYLLRMPSLRTEAQATSALEGTYAPLADVLTADDESPMTVEMREILNYVAMAKLGFEWVDEERPLTLGLLEDLHGRLMRGTALEAESGRLRTSQVVIGWQPGAGRDLTPVEAARFVPAPPGDQLRAGVEDLLTWVGTDHTDRIDPVVVVGMAHYQFEMLHPFRDGNGRLGRYLIVLTLLRHGLLTEPALTVSPWFEARRAEYDDALLGVSTDGDWDTFLTFFAHGLAEAATTTRRQMLELVKVQETLSERVRGSRLRSAHALSVVDLAIAHPSFTVRTVAGELGVSYGRANVLVGQLVDLGILHEVGRGSGTRRFAAPEVLRVLLGRA